MFIVNREVLSQKNNPKLWEWYQSKLTEIKKLGKKYYQFNTQKTARFQPTNRGNRKIIKHKSLPLNATFNNADLDEFQTWQYVASANAIKYDNGNAELKESKNFKFDNETILDAAKDIEIVFFLIYISNYLERKVLYLKDADKENKELADKNAIRFEVGYLISSPSSPIAPEKLESEQLFRTICISWGVTDVHEKPIYQLRNELQMSVDVSQTNIVQTQRGYEAFIKDCYSYGDSELRSNVMLAIEKKLLVYNDMYWKLIGKGGNEKIVETMESHHMPKAVDMLVKKFSDNNTLKALLLEIVNNNLPDKPKEDETQHELRRQLMEAGYEWNVLKKMKVAELKAELEKVNIKV